MRWRRSRDLEPADGVAGHGCHVRLGSRGWRSAVAVGAAAVLAGCSTPPTDEEVLGSLPPVAEVGAPADPTSPPESAASDAALEASLLEVLGSEDFSAEVAISGWVELADGSRIRQRGWGVVSGEDSQILLVSDHADLVTGRLDRWAGGIVGPGGAGSIARATRVVDSVVYETEDGWRWRESGDETSSSVGRIFGALARVAAFEPVGMVTVEGESLHRLRPVVEPTYDAGALALAPEETAGLETATEVVVDAGGVPRSVTVTAVSPSDGADVVARELELMLADVGRPRTVEPPLEVWTSLVTLGLEAQAGVPATVDMDVPLDWIVEQNEPTFMLLTDPDRQVQLLAGLDVVSGTDIDRWTRELLAIVDMDGAEVEDVRSTRFPARFASLLDEDSGFGMVHVQMQGPVSFAVVWLGPVGDSVLQRAFFETMTSTIRWTGGGRTKVPGNTIAAVQLQGDARDQVLGQTGVDGGCEDGEVVWTEVLGADTAVSDPGSAGDFAWRELWFVDACGSLAPHELLFVSDGLATTIVSEGGPRALDAPAGAWESVDGPGVAADRLRAQPWMVDAETGVDPLAIAYAVARARFDGYRLYVLVLAEAPPSDLGEFAEEVLDLLGVGTVLVVAAPAVGYATHGDADSGLVVEEAFQGAVDAEGHLRAVERFVETLVGR